MSYFPEATAQEDDMDSSSRLYLLKHALYSCHHFRMLTTVCHSRANALELQRESHACQAPNSKTKPSVVTYTQSSLLASMSPRKDLERIV